MYWLEDTSKKYDRTVCKYIAKMATRRTAPMKAQNFNRFDPVLINCSLKYLKLFCNTSGGQEGGAKWALLFFMNNTASAVLNARLSDYGTDKKLSRPARSKTRNFTTFTHIVNFLVKTYATNEAVAETESDITCFTQPSNMTLSQYVEELVTKTLRCGDLYENVPYALNEIFIKDLVALVRHSTLDYWVKKKDENLSYHAFHATSIRQMERHDLTSKWTKTAELKPIRKRWKLASPHKSVINAVKSGLSSSLSAFVH